MARPKQNKEEVVQGATPPVSEEQIAVAEIISLEQTETVDEKIISITGGSVVKATKVVVPDKDSYRVVIRGHGFLPNPQVISRSVHDILKSKKGITIEYVD